MLRIDRVGLTTVQDLGRRGWAHLGVSPSGAADRGSARLANRLAGNDMSAALFETSGGFVFTAMSDVVVVMTGSECAATTATQPIGMCRPVVARRGEQVRMDHLIGGMRTYVAIGGGVQGEALLGSRSHDTLGGIVPVALHEGVQLGTGRAQTSATSLDVVVAPRRIERARLTPGPHEHLFAADLRSRVTRSRLLVSTTSSRVGVRLTGASLDDAVTGELESFPLVRGAVQVTPANELVVMLADHPTTGGYPVIGVVVPEDVDALSQLVGGETVSLAW